MAAVVVPANAVTGGSARWAPNWPSERFGLHHSQHRQGWGINASTGAVYKGEGSANM